MSASAGVSRSTKIKCGCGYSVELPDDPSEDFVCPDCGAQLGRMIAEARRDGPDASSRIVMTQTMRRPMPSLSPMAARGLRFGIGTVVFLLAAAVGITLLIVKILSSR